MNSDTILSINKLVAGYGETEILHKISIMVHKNEIVSIIGPNGAGKSTILKAILGTLDIKSGEIFLKKTKINGVKPSDVVKKGVGYVPQTDNVFVSLSVHENLEMGAWTIENNLNDKFEELYNLFPDLKDKKKQLAGQLSGGQRQMLAMAKALILDAKVLLLDEPTAGLSPKYRLEIFDTIQRINKSGLPILMVEQNAKQALQISHRGYVLVDGSNRYTGTGQDLSSDPDVARMFLGSRG